jgi:predicted lipoprotein with Yx(FWY)xxD motif
MRPLILVLVALALVACGSPSYGAAGTGSASPSPMSATIKVANTARFGAILTDGNGRTLYRFTPEKDGRVVCTGACATLWFPVLAPTGQTSLTSVALPGKLGTVTRPDGKTQAAYNEFPLYTYSGDTKPGDINGQGFMGKWFVVPEVFPQDADNDADGTAAAAPSATPRPSAAPAATPAPVRSAAPAPVQVVPTPTPCNFSQPNFNDGDGDNAGTLSDGDGCG